MWRCLSSCRRGRRTGPDPDRPSKAFETVKMFSENMSDDHRRTVLDIIASGVEQRIHDELRPLRKHHPVLAPRNPIAGLVRPEGLRERNPCHPRHCKRGGRGALRSERWGRAERGGWPLRPFWSDLNLKGLRRIETEGGRERASKATRARSGPTALERMSIKTLSSIPSISLYACPCLLASSSCIFRMVSSSIPSGILPSETDTRPSTTLSRASLIFPESIIFIMRLRSAWNSMWKSVLGAVRNGIEM